MHAAAQNVNKWPAVPSAGARAAGLNAPFTNSVYAPSGETNGELSMIIMAAMLASGSALPWLDRSWLNDRARIESRIGGGEQASRAKPDVRPALTKRSTLRVAGEIEINGM